MKARITPGLLVVADAALLNISLLLVLTLRYDGQATMYYLAWLHQYTGLFIALTGIKILGFYCFRLYSSLWKYAGVYEMMLVGAAAMLGSVIVLGVVTAVGAAIPRSVIATGFFVDVMLVGGARFAYRACNRLRNGKAIRKDGSCRRVLIVGGGEAGAVIIRELLSHPDLLSTPTAIIDDDRAKLGKKINGVPIVGGREAIVETVLEKRIDEIILAIPSAGKAVINEIYSQCARTSCKVKILPSVSQLIDGSVVIQKVRNVNIEDLLGREPVSMKCEDVFSYINTKTVLVTGGGGSIGSELCRQIMTYRPKRLIILDNYENNAFDIQNELTGRYPETDIVTLIANIREKQRIEDIFLRYRPEVVFHAAAHKHVPLMEMNPCEAVKNNIFGTMNVMECADKYRASRFVLISSDKAVNPTNIMGATKRAAEMLIQAFNTQSNTEFVAVRFGNVLGSNGSVVPLFKKQIEQGGPVTVTHPEVTRFFMTIPEAVQLVLQAGAMGSGGEIFVLDMGKPVKIYDLAKNMIKLSGFEPETDIKITFTGLRPGEKLYEELLLEEEGLGATRNDKIFIAKPVFTDLPLLRRELEILNRLMAENVDEVTDYMARIVPTYIKAPPFYPRVPHLGTGLKGTLT